MGRVTKTLEIWRVCFLVPSDVAVAVLVCFMSLISRYVGAKLCNFLPDGLGTCTSIKLRSCQANTRALPHGVQRGRGRDSSSPHPTHGRIKPESPSASELSSFLCSPPLHELRLLTEGWRLNGSCPGPPDVTSPAGARLVRRPKPRHRHTQHSRIAWCAANTNTHKHRRQLLMCDS